MAAKAASPGKIAMFAGIGDARWWGETSQNIAGVRVSNAGSHNDIPKGPWGGNLHVTMHLKYTYTIETQAGADEWNRKRRGGAPSVSVGQTVTYEAETHYAVGYAYTMEWINGRDSGGSQRPKPGPPKTLEQTVQTYQERHRANPSANLGPAPGY